MKVQEIIKGLYYTNGLSPSASDEIHIKEIHPGVTPEMLFEYIMEILGWPEIHKVKHEASSRILHFTVDGELLFLFFGSKAQMLYPVSDWMEPFCQYEKSGISKNKKSKIEIQQIIDRSREFLNISKISLSDLFGFRYDKQAREELEKQKRAAEMKSMFPEHIQRFL